MFKCLTKDIILVLVVIAGLVSFFYNPLNTEAIKYLQDLAAMIVGFYLGKGQLPIMGAFKK